MDNNILIVPSPSSLSTKDTHAQQITRLCEEHSLVILLHFGDEEYTLPLSYALPDNAKIVSYEYETLDDSLSVVKEYLQGFGVGVVSRHRNGRIPFIMSGSFVSLPSNVNLNFYDGSEH